MRSEKGFVLPMTLIMLVLLASFTGVLTATSVSSFQRNLQEEGGTNAYLAAEGAMNQLIGQMSVYGPLFDQLAPIATKPSGYTSYSPAAYSTANGIPDCSGLGCQRSLYPTSGGLLKNYGPLENVGGVVSSARTIQDQLVPTDPVTADATLGSVNGWTQLERLDEAPLSVGAVGGNLSSSLAEGGNAKEIRYRVTGQSIRTVRGRLGTSTLVSIVVLRSQ